MVVARTLHRASCTRIEPDVILRIVAAHGLSRIAAFLCGGDGGGGPHPRSIIVSVPHTMALCHILAIAATLQPSFCYTAVPSIADALTTEFDRASKQARDALRGHAVIGWLRDMRTRVPFLQRWMHRLMFGFHRALDGEENKMDVEAVVAKAIQNGIIRPSLPRIRAALTVVTETWDVMKDPPPQDLAEAVALMENILPSSLLNDHVSQPIMAHAQACFVGWRARFRGGVPDRIESLHRATARLDTSMRCHAWESLRHGLFVEAVRPHEEQAEICAWVRESLGSWLSCPSITHANLGHILCSLFESAPSIEAAVSSSLGAWLTASLQAALRDGIPEVLACVTRCRALVHARFARNPHLARLTERVCHNACSGNALADKLARHVHMCLRKKDHSAATSALALLAFVSDKDRYILAHRGFLARRLLANPVATMDGSECDSLRLVETYTSRSDTRFMWQMLKDVQSPIVEHFVTETKAPCRVMTLTTNAWPARVRLPVLVVPSMFVTARDALLAQYQTRFPSRRLDFVWDAGWVRVRLWWEQERNALVRVSTLQAFALMALVDAEVERLPLGNIAEVLQVDVRHVARILHPLVHTHGGLLAVKQGSKTAGGTRRAALGDMDEVFVNPAYRPRRGLVEFASPELAVANAGAQERIISAHRAHQLDAAIVRVMKTHKRLRHADLVAQLQPLVTMFRVEPRQVKRRIAELIAREYMERCDDGWYQYVM